MARYFHLDEADVEFISNRRGDQNRFGVALQLTSIRFLGTSIPDLALVPTNIQIFIARQIKIEDINILSDYAKRDITKYEHITLICNHYNYHNFNDQPWSFRLIRLLYSRSWLSDERPSLMFDFAIAWLNQNKILLPGISTLMRLISRTRERTSSRLWRVLSSRGRLTKGNLKYAKLL